MTGLPRKRPCMSCPYRKDAPSGVWHQEEYEKLPGYDGEIIEQIEANAVRLFGCHQGDGRLCAGWAAYRDPGDLLAVRLALSKGHISEAILDYTTDVPLWASGREAAEHGMAEIDAPGTKANKVVGKLARLPGKTIG